MKKIFSLFFVFLLHSAVWANDSLEISLLTCSPGSEIYSVFGHSAIKVIDYETGEGVIYNFGMFSFGTSNFALKFVKGSLEYCLGKQYIGEFIAEYTYENRFVTEQTLYLTEEQKEFIVTRLEYLYLPENRNYRYAFLQKNCSTEIRDLLEDAGITFEHREVPETSRQLIAKYLKQNLWIRLGINMALGSTIDKSTDSYQRMFLPDYLHDEVAKTVNGKSDLVEEEHFLVEEDLFLNQTDKSGKKSVWWYSPLFIFFLLFLITFFCQNKAITLSSFIFIAILGTIVLGINLLSDHPEVKTNFNLLWCNPLYFIYIPFIVKDKIPKFIPLTFLGLILLTIIFWMCDLQQFDIAIIPLLLLLINLNFRLWRKAA